MRNVVINMCEKLYNDRLRNDRSLWNRKSDNNNKNNIGDPCLGLNMGDKCLVNVYAALWPVHVVVGGKDWRDCAGLVAVTKPLDRRHTETRDGSRDPPLLSRNQQFRRPANSTYG